MSLIIDYKDNQNEGILRRREWHLGEPLPYIDSRVVTFQADGDELNLLFDAIRRMTSALKGPTTGGPVDLLRPANNVPRVGIDAYGNMYIDGERV